MEKIKSKEERIKELESCIAFCEPRTNPSNNTCYKWFRRKIKELRLKLETLKNS